MNLLHLVDRLEELVGSAQKMPIGNRAMVDRRRLLDLIDQMRIAIPQEVRDAQELLAQRAERNRDAEEEARLIVARAEERAAQLVEQHELTLAARHRADDLARQAEVRIEERIQRANADIEGRIDESRGLAEQQMDAADDYARELLQRLDRQLQAFLRSVQSGLAQLARPEPQPTYQPASESASDPLGPEHVDTRAALQRLSEWRDSQLPPAPVVDDDPPRDVDLPPQQQPARETTADRLASGPVPPAQRDVVDGPRVIDDFAMPSLDDEPAGGGHAGGNSSPSTDRPRPGRSPGS
ncbi:MAG: hypothetical protein EXR63_05640 [Dehalococcoidia bacterium]|nr:hypothetical protein [Dehalococcoidia bacterium]